MGGYEFILNILRITSYSLTCNAHTTSLPHISCCGPWIARMVVLSETRI